MKLILSPMFVALSLAAGLATSAQAQVKGNIEAGEGKVAMCIGCHGIMDYKTNFPEVYHVPKIAGQNAKYIETVLGEYKKGTRKHPSMRGIAGSLTEQDIADVAAYYTALGEIKGAPELPAPRAASADVTALLQKGACVSCHGDNFAKPIDPSYPKIAGQHADYLFVALKSYKVEKNANVGRGNAIMGGVAKQFTNAELKALANYVSSLDGDLHTVPQSRFR